MLNQTLFSMINDWAGRYLWLDRFGIFFAEYSGYVLIALLLVMYLHHRTRKHFLMLTHGIVAGLIARGVVELIRLVYPHTRPSPIHQFSSSFPSGHASFFFALSTIVYMYNKRLGSIFFIISALMGLARVFVGVHWPADILGGLLVGVLIAYLVRYGSERVFKLFIKPTIPSSKAF